MTRIRLISMYQNLKLFKSLNIRHRRLLSTECNITELLVPHFSEITKKYNDIGKKMQGETDSLAISRLGREYNHLGRAVELIDRHSIYMKDIQDLELLEYEENQKGASGQELAELATEELQTSRQSLKELENTLITLLMPRDAADDRSAVVEIRAGTGGDEASLFATQLYSMYEKYSERKRWSWEPLSLMKTEVGGYKEVQISISGDRVYSSLKFESGVHRVQRVPENDTRVHTSAVSVVILPEAQEVDVEVKSSDLRIDVFRAQGAGGQSVNRTESAVRITHLPTNIVVSMQDERSQIQNRAKAMKILRSRLFDLKRREAQEARLNLRAAANSTGDRSDKIRTYNYPQDRVTDHRIGVSVTGVQRVMSGEMLDHLIISLLEVEEKELLQDFISDMSNS
mmetsp:Transcript_16098/g.16231  ORF Transcript_16098/g.16231 Transcript_16098/m.16231 type:complete len:399 (+) Transcript_16098:106-1302(+)